MLTVKLLEEAGYNHAMYGLSLSFGASIEKMPKVANRLAHKGGGENKFLEAMIVWLEVRAPRYFWQEADTYRLSTKQSESTMHTLLKRPLTKDDFQEDEGPDGEIDPVFLAKFNEHIAKKDFRWVKRHLSESFMQCRVWCFSYKTLQNLWYQRHDHKLPEWHDYLGQLMKQIKYPQFIIPTKESTHE